MCETEVKIVKCHELIKSMFGLIGNFDYLISGWIPRSIIVRICSPHISADCDNNLALGIQWITQFFFCLFVYQNIVSNLLYWFKKHQPIVILLCISGRLFLAVYFAIIVSRFIAIIFLIWLASVGFFIVASFIIICTTGCGCNSRFRCCRWCWRWITTFCIFLLLNIIRIWLYSYI